MIDMFRRFVQLRLYTKRVVAGWAVILLLGSMFDMCTLFWLAIMMAFAISAIKHFVGFEMITGQLTDIKGKIEQVSGLIPRASTLTGSGN